MIGKYKHKTTTENYTEIKNVSLPINVDESIWFFNLGFNVL